MIGHPGKKLLFMGAEIGQWEEWNHDTSLDWHLLEHEPHKALQRCLRDLLHLYQAEPGLHEVDFDWHGFEWVDFHDADGNIVAFFRRGRSPRDTLLVACNFSPVPREGYIFAVDQPARYREIFNSDSALYGGGNVGNGGFVEAVERPLHGKPCSLTMTLPPLATVILKRT
jgi:1,4-alpha-glucan branching enzyme